MSTNTVQQRVLVTTQLEVQTRTPARTTAKPQTETALQQADTVSFSGIRSEVLDLEAQITKLKLQEEQQLAGQLNDQLTQLESAASQRRAVLTSALQIVSEQRSQLPMTIQYGSVDYGYMRQIEGQETAIMQVQNQLEAYLGRMRRQANTVISRVNSRAIAGTADMDNRIGTLRTLMADLASSPLTQNLRAEQFK